MSICVPTQILIYLLGIVIMVFTIFCIDIMCSMIYLAVTEKCLNNIKPRLYKPHIKLIKTMLGQ